MAKRRTKIEALVDAAFMAVGTNRQFNIMDLGKIHRAGMAAAPGGPAAILAAVSAACDQYEQK